MKPAPAPSSPSIWNKPHVWGFTTYFTEGLPFTIIRSLSGFYFRARGANLRIVGMTSFYGLPWILKFLIGPYVDEFGTKRRWLLSVQGMITLIILAAAFLSPLSAGLPLIGALFMLGAFTAAVHDIAIDGYYLAALSPEEQSRFLGHRVMAYRVAMLTGQSVVATVGARYGWPQAFLLAGLLMGGFFVYHLLMLPECEQGKRPMQELGRALLRQRVILVAALLAVAAVAWRALMKSELFTDAVQRMPWLGKFDFPALVTLLLLGGLIAAGLLRRRLQALMLRRPDSFYTRAFLSFMEQEKIGIVLAFIILVRIGEWLLSAMAAPFIVDMGIKVHYGWISGFVGLPLSIAGAMLGGFFISRFGMKRLIWPFLLLQNLTNVVYMVLALGLQSYVVLNTGAATPTPIGSGNLLAVAAVHGFDQFAGGLGTAVLTIYLMRICTREFKAAHFAIGSGLMSVGSLVAGICSGYLTSWLGYGAFFGISFLFSVPGMLLIPFIPKGEKTA